MAKTKGRRQSKNIEDRRSWKNKTVQNLLKDSDLARQGYTLPDRTFPGLTPGIKVMPYVTDSDTETIFSPIRKRKVRNKTIMEGN